MNTPNPEDPTQPPAYVEVTLTGLAIADAIDAANAGDGGPVEFQLEDRWITLVNPKPWRTQIANVNQRVRVTLTPLPGEPVTVTGTVGGRRHEALAGWLEVLRDADQVSATEADVDAARHEVDVARAQVDAAEAGVAAAQAEQLLTEVLEIITDDVLRCLGVPQVGPELELDEISQAQVRSARRSAQHIQCLVRALLDGNQAGEAA